jgi:hypothetical protein
MNDILSVKIGFIIKKNSHKDFSSMQLLKMLFARMK